MRTFAVVWTYIANFHVQTVEAASPEDAIERICGAYLKHNEDFKKKACVYAFWGKPELQQIRGAAPVRDQEAGR